METAIALPLWNRAIRPIMTSSPVEMSLMKGLSLFNQGTFFEAHEVWEEAWGDSEEDDRHLLQGLIQVAAAFYKLEIGQPAGTAKLLEKALCHLQAIPNTLYGLSLGPLIVACESWENTARQMVSEWRTDFDKADLPRIAYGADVGKGH